MAPQAEKTLVYICKGYKCCYSKWTPNGRAVSSTYTHFKNLATHRSEGMRKMVLNPGGKLRGLDSCAVKVRFAYVPAEGEQH